MYIKNIIFQANNKDYHIELDNQIEGTSHQEIRSYLERAIEKYNFAQKLYIKNYNKQVKLYIFASKEISAATEILNNLVIQTINLKF